jgi:hypothetical protein
MLIATATLVVIVRFIVTSCTVDGVLREEGAERIDNIKGR